MPKKTANNPQDLGQIAQKISAVHQKISASHERISASHKALASSDKKISSAHTALVQDRADQTPARVRERLEPLFVQGVSESVKRRYAHLPERAAELDFGPLEDNVVVLDTETTGLNFNACQLIEISASRLEGREIVDTFHRFVDPGHPIPPAIQKLTGISNNDVRDAPLPEEAVEDLKDFVGDAPILAHNAIFDRTFVEKISGGGRVSDMWVDTLSFSRIALPALATHKLADMAAAFGCAAVTHRASDDVDALAALWPILLTALCDLPAGLLYELSEAHPQVQWTFRPLLKQLSKYARALQGTETAGCDGGDSDENNENAGAASSQTSTSGATSTPPAASTSGATSTPDAQPRPFSLKATREALLEEERQNFQPERAVADGDFSIASISTHQIDADFSPEGLVGSIHPNMERRSEQLEMAHLVTRTLNNSHSAAIEAGTGVGKSLAYLVPALRFAQKNKLTLGIATKTNALTDQLISHELPALAQKHPLSFCSLKGYDHYPCLLRMEASLDRPLPFDHVPAYARNTAGADMLTALAVSMSYACQVLYGDVDSLGIRWRNVPKSLLTVSSGECAHARCPFYPHACYVHGARKHAAQCDLVVTNHSLLLRDIALEGRILPPIKHWIVDEAHNFEQEARRQWAYEFSPEATRNLFEHLGTLKTGLIHEVLVEAVNLDSHALLTRLLTKIAIRRDQSLAALQDCFSGIHSLLSVAPRSGAGSYDEVILWISKAVRSSERWVGLTRLATKAFSEVEEIGKQAASVADLLSQEHASSAQNFSQIARDLTTLKDTLALIFTGVQDTMVYSAVLSRKSRGAGEGELLRAEKLSPGQDLANLWLSQIRSVLFTSATIAVGEDFSHFNEGVGTSYLPARQYSTHSLSSSYDFEHNMKVFLPHQLPDPNSPTYIQQLADMLVAVHETMEGSVLTLCTSRREMERLFELMEPSLSKQGLDLAYQDNKTPVQRLRSRFMNEERLSLLALKSFWEGFDGRGATLRCVVITRLPFSSPTDPLSQERAVHEHNAWWRYSLPEAVIAVKQAAGRLIRSSSDKGILILADPRVQTKGYGPIVTKSLPSQNIELIDVDALPREIARWRKLYE